MISQVPRRVMGGMRLSRCVCLLKSLDDRHNVTVSFWFLFFFLIVFKFGMITLYIVSRLRLLVFCVYIFLSSPQIRAVFANNLFQTKPDQIMLIRTNVNFEKSS